MTFPRTLTPKGTGLPDFQTAIQSVSGSVRVYGASGSIRAYGSVIVSVAAYIGRIGTLATGGGGGTIKYANRVGTLQRVGTVRYVQAGSLGRIERVGTIGNISRTGTIGRLTSVGSVHIIVASQDVMTGVDVQARYRPGTAMRDRKPLGPGSTWTGSWQDVSNYRRKTYTFLSIGTPGSFAAIVGLIGSGVGGATGTLHLRRIGRGSYGTFDFEGAFRYTRPWFRRGGGTFVAGRGSVTIALARQT